MRFDNLPDRLPWYGAAHVDPAGRIATNTLAGFYEEGAYSVFVIDADGAPLGTVRLPAGFRLRQVARDVVVGTVRQSDTGETHVVAHRIVRGGG